MHPKLKITLAALCVAVMPFIFSCSKNGSDVVTPAPKEDNSAALIKMIVLGLGQASSTFNSSNNSMQPNNQSGLKTNAYPAYHTCGEVVNKRTDKTVVVGDTTRNIYNRDIFTYMCNGYRNDGYNVDAYTQLDTLITTETDANFKNIFKVTLGYDVRSTQALFIMLNVNGFTSTSSYTSKLSGSKTVESHLINTSYNWHDVSAMHHYPQDLTSFQGGVVKFSTRMVDIDQNTPAAGLVTTFTGYITFIPWINMARVEIFMSNGKTYDRTYTSAPAKQLRVSNLGDIRI